MAGVLSALGMRGVVLHRRRGRAQPRPEPLQSDARRAPAVGRPLVLVVVALGTVTTLALGGIAVVDRVGRGTILTVLDVGQGDAVLLESRSGSRLLVDGGPDPDRLLVALDERNPGLGPADRPRRAQPPARGPRRRSRDAPGALRRRTRPGARHAWTGARLAGVGRDLRAGGPSRGTVATGGRLRLDEIALDVLWPDPGAVPREPPDTGTGINNVSVVLLGEVDG